VLDVFSSLSRNKSLINLFCDYQKRKVVVAGLLELFLPFGFGHFYAGHFYIATTKLIYNVIVYSLGCVLYCKGFKQEDTMELMLICLIMTCLIPVWNIVDLFLFFTGVYTDGYGIPLV